MEPALIDVIWLPRGRIVVLGRLGLGHGQQVTGKSVTGLWFLETPAAPPSGGPAPAGSPVDHKLMAVLAPPTQQGGGRDTHVVLTAFDIDPAQASQLRLIYRWAPFGPTEQRAYVLDNTLTITDIVPRNSEVVVVSGVGGLTLGSHHVGVIETRPTELHALVRIQHHDGASAAWCRRVPVAGVESIGPFRDIPARERYIELRASASTDPDHPCIEVREAQSRNALGFVKGQSGHETKPTLYLGHVYRQLAELGKLQAVKAPYTRVGDLVTEMFPPRDRGEGLAIPGSLQVERLEADGAEFADACFNDAIGVVCLTPEVRLLCHDPPAISYVLRLGPSQVIGSALFLTYQARQWAVASESDEYCMRAWQMAARMAGRMSVGMEAAAGEVHWIERPEPGVEHRPLFERHPALYYALRSRDNVGAIPTRTARGEALAADLLRLEGEDEQVCAWVAHLPAEAQAGCLLAKLDGRLSPFQAAAIAPDLEGWVALKAIMSARTSLGTGQPSQSVEKWLEGCLSEVATWKSWLQSVAGPVSQPASISDLLDFEERLQDAQADVKAQIGQFRAEWEAKVPSRVLRTVDKLSSARISPDRDKVQIGQAAERIDSGKGYHGIAVAILNTMETSAGSSPSIPLSAATRGEIYALLDSQSMTLRQTMADVFDRLRAVLDTAQAGFETQIRAIVAGSVGGASTIMLPAPVAFAGDDLLQELRVDLKGDLLASLDGSSSVPAPLLSLARDIAVRPLGWVADGSFHADLRSDWSAWEAEVNRLCAAVSPEWREVAQFATRLAFHRLAHKQIVNGLLLIVEQSRTCAGTHGYDIARRPDVAEKLAAVGRTAGSSPFDVNLMMADMHELKQRIANTLKDTSYPGALSACLAGVHTIPAIPPL